MKNFIAILFLFSLVNAFAGKKDKALENKYKLAKELFSQEKYQESLIEFKSLAQLESEQNIYIENAMYYYSLISFKMNSYEEANFMLFKLMNEYPVWESIDEAIYLYINTALETKNYYKIYLFIDKIKNKEIAKDADAMKQFYYSQLPVDELWAILGKNPEDVGLANLLARKISRNHYGISQYMDKLNYLIQDYKLKGEYFRKVELPKSVKKDTFQIAVLLPYLLNEYNEVNSNFKKLYYYEFLTGLKISIEEQNQDSTSPYYKLFVYDTEKKSAKITEILSYPELGQMDLVITSMKRNEELFINFSKNKHVHVLDPFLRSDTIMSLPGLLFFQQPSYVNEGKVIADFVSDQVNTGKVFIFYEENNSSSLVIAQSCHDELIGIQDTIVIKAVSGDSAERMKEDLLRAADSDYGIKAIILCSNNNLVKSNVISALENGDIQSPIIVSKKWLNYKGVEFEQYKRRNFYFSSPGYIQTNVPEYTAFRDSCEEKIGIKPLKKYAYWGYDLINYWSFLLAKYGNIVNEGIENELFYDSKLTVGFQYGKLHSNQTVPLIRFNENYQFEYVNRP